MFIRQDMQKTYNINKAYIASLKNKPCEFCGKQYEPECMDFDHKDPLTKSFNVARGALRNRLILEAEIDKCRLLCCYCHATITRQYKKCLIKTNKHKTPLLDKKRKIIEDHKKDKPCNNCGGYFNDWLMEFDHLDPFTKKKSVAKLYASSISLILEEISKCQLLCIRCHRLITKRRLVDK